MRVDKNVPIFQDPFASQLTVVGNAPQALEMMI